MYSSIEVPLNISDFVLIACHQEFKCQISDPVFVPHHYSIAFSRDPDPALNYFKKTNIKFLFNFIITPLYKKKGGL